MNIQQFVQSLSDDEVVELLNDLRLGFDSPKITFNLKTALDIELANRRLNR